ncbi:hypothetical protein EYM_03620 [Ignicoccus islandicus DSM 13165]|uniref:Uncharacterized protein n=1 Tax=Ignicoccus islandicus DSM 13165 TaxID=940295 RepID=A0A0U3DY56_9CREN|nr:hypothetical protein [Ignicoccus islandicus]ALU12426.1 hypothetical protein EYM_03620 [Ignicoccus islandicus DSM 13165]
MRSLSTQDWLIIMVIGVVLLWTIIVKYIGPAIATWITTIYMLLTMVLALVAPTRGHEED